MSSAGSKRVLIISTMGGHPWGGSEYLWKDIAERLLASGHHVEVSVYGWGAKTSEQIQALTAQGVTIHTRSKIYAPQLLLKPYALFNRHFSAARQIKRDLSRARPDFVLISCGSLSDLLLPGLPEAFTARPPRAHRPPYEVIFQTNLEQQTFPADQLDRIRAFLTGARRALFVSHRLIQQAQRQLAWEGNNAQLVHNPVNLDFEKAGTMPWLQQSAENVVHWACVGRLEARIKGQLILLQVLARPKWKARNWTLEFFGEGPDRNLIQAAIDRYELGDRITLCGFVNDVASIWRKNHALILPSYYEGQPLVLQEAMACGRVGIGTDVGGMADLLDESKGTGFLVAAPLPDALDTAMERAWAARNDWESIGQRARAHLNAFRGNDPVGDFAAGLLEENSSQT